MRFDDAYEWLMAEGHTEAAASLAEFRHLTRRRRRPRRPLSSTKMTPEVRKTIIKLYQNTDLTQHQIAATLNVNPGRVTEVLMEERKNGHSHL